MRSAALAGRDSELQVVRRALSATARPAVLLVRGDAGIGKSRLVATACADEPALTAVTAACLPLAEKVPLLPVADLMRAVSEVEQGQWLNAALNTCPTYVRAEIANFVPGLPVTTSATLGGADGGDIWARQRLFTAVRECLSALAQTRSVAILIEDLHWADPSTLDLLDYLVRAGRSLPLPIIATVRHDDADVSTATWTWLARLERAVGVEVLTLAGLSLAQTAEQLTMLTGSAPAPRVVAEIFDRSEGNPLFTEQIAEAGDAFTLPPDLRGAVEAKLRRLDETALHVVRVLSLAARPLSPEHLAVVCGIAASAARTSLRQLTGARLARPAGAANHFRSQHALIADVIADGLPAEESSKLHRRLAEAKARWTQRGLAGEIAGHWREAGSAEDELRWLIKAADEATEMHAPAQSADHLRRAVELWSFVTDPSAVAGLALHDLYLAADEALWTAGLNDDERDLAEQAVSRLADAPEPVRAMLLRGLARAQSVTRPETAPETLAAARTLLEHVPPTLDHVKLLMDEAALHRLQGRYTEYAEAITRGLTASEACGNSEWVPRLLTQRAWYEMSTGRLDDALQTINEVWSRETLSIRETTTAAVYHSDILLKAARYAAVVDMAEPILDRIEDLGMADAVPALVLRANLAEALLALGRVDQARKTLLVATTGAPTRATRPVHFCRADVETASGELAAALSRLSALETVAPDDTEFHIDLTRIRAEALIWSGKPETAARELIDALHAIANRDMAKLQDWALVLAARAHADSIEAAGPGEPDRADRAVKVLRTLRSALVYDPLGQPDIPGSSRACLASWEAELSRLRTRSDSGLWHAAADAWHSVDVPFRVAYCRWREAEAWLADPGGTARDQARRALLTAITAARGHEPLTRSIVDTAARARIDLSREPPAVDRNEQTAVPFALTQREIDVLRLVALGKTNSEIGATLFISAKTASVHVTSILRKLGVRTRTHAATIAERSGLLDRAV